MSQPVPHDMALASEKRMFITGRVVLFCPHCGAINDHLVRPATWKLQCQNRNCRRMITWAMHDVPSGHASRSPELTLAAVASSPFARE